MKARQSSTRWLGLALACGFLTFAVTTQAAKPPKPPPTPTGPAYRIVSLGALGGSPVGAAAINGPGWLAGASPQGTAFGLAPEGSISAPVYFRDTTPADGNNDLIHALPGLPAYQSSGVWDINDTGWVAGLSVLDDGTNWYESPTIWVGNTPIDLSYVTTSAWGILDTWATGINNLGLVVIGPDLYWRDCDISSYVVVPKDNDGDSVPDTWFEDLNGDGLNDLLKLIAPPSGYNAQEGFWTHVFEPRGINDAGQIILNPWTGSPCRLTPDYADADGDGNPWYADANGDGFNDLMVELIGLGGAGSYATSINAAGQVVGNSNGRAVLWNFTGGTQTVTDLGLLSKSVRSMGAAAINDVGQIVGGATYQNGRTSFLLQNGKMYDLATLLVNGAGWTYLTANDINNQGIITGNAYLNEVWQGFVAIPVTQP